MSRCKNIEDDGAAIGSVLFLIFLFGLAVALESSTRNIGGPRERMSMLDPCYYSWLDGVVTPISLAVYITTIPADVVIETGKALNNVRLWQCDSIHGQVY